MSWGPLIHGHAPRGLIKALAAAARDGTSYGAPSPLEVELGERVRRLMPSLERVRFVSSGTEAAMSAVRVARAATGREKIVKFEGLLSRPRRRVPRAGRIRRADARRADQPGRDARRRRRHAGRQLQRPRRRSSGCSTRTAVRSPRSSSSRSPATWGWCRRPTASCARCASSARAHGALLIFDEVISGFRAGAGGAQALSGVVPISPASARSSAAACRSAPTAAAPT